MVAVIVYGSYGFTGDLIVRRALQVGLRPILAGRSETKLTEQARALGLPFRCFSLEHPDPICAALADQPCVLNCAGPFADTARAVLDACLRTDTHYLDITGEVDVLEFLVGKDRDARDAGIMILPGVGFDVVPTDCVASHLQKRLPGASHLQLAFTVNGSLSRGTLKSMLRNLHRARLVRRAGKLVQQEAVKQSCEVDFGDGPRKTFLTSWGDLSTAFWSTGIPNIEVFAAPSGGWRLIQNLAPRIAPLVATSLIRLGLEGIIDRGPRGPRRSTMDRRRIQIWGQVCDEEGGRAVCLLDTPDGYLFTALSSVAIVQRVLQGDWTKGFQTPSTVYGPDFILDIEGVRRLDQ